MESKSQERKPAEVRRFEILYAARQLFTERGFDRVSMEDVASKVGISKAAVYLYFHSKAELFLEVIEQGRDKLISDLEEVFTDPPHKSLSQKLDAAKQVIQRFAPVIRITQQLSESGFPDSDFPPRIIKPFIRKTKERRERILELLGAVFIHGQEEGEVRRDLPASEMAKMFVTYALTLVISQAGYESAKEILFHGILTKEERQ
jgi:AcrR family transcriptional regulator